MTVSTVALLAGLIAKGDDTSIQSWARGQAVGAASHPDMEFEVGEAHGVVMYEKELGEAPRVVS